MSNSQTRRSPNAKTHQYDDWVCLMCQNLNYSFRKTCNRCRIQTKANNDYILEFYTSTAYLTLAYESKSAEQADPNPEKETCSYGQDEFPKCLFLQLNVDEQEQSTLMRRDVPQLQTPRWINCLIGD